MSKFKITDNTTFNDLNKEFNDFLVTGKEFLSNKKFSRVVELSQIAFRINLWRGRVWGRYANGKKVLLKTVYN